MALTSFISGKITSDAAVIAERTNHGEMVETNNKGIRKVKLAQRYNPRVVSAKLTLGNSQRLPEVQLIRRKKIKIVIV